jgi:hypothetical protein
MCGHEVGSIPSPAGSLTYELGWDRVPLAGNIVSFDTETVAISDLNRRIAPLVLSQFGDGYRNIILKPSEVPAFITADRRKQWVGFNVAFDFWVLDRWLMENYKEQERQHLWDMMDQGRVHDLMYLDMLIRLARGTDSPTASTDLQPDNLGTVAARYADIVINKDDPYRLRYGEIQDVDWGEVDPGFFLYAAGDVYGTYWGWLGAVRAAEALRATKMHDVTWPDADEQYGLLTELIQTRASVALADIGRRGIGVDLNRADLVRQQMKIDVDKSISWLQENHRDLFKFYATGLKKGQLKLTEAAQLPQTNQKYLIGMLSAVERQLELDIPRSDKRGQISLSAKLWMDVAGDHEFIQHWAGIAHKTKLLQFVNKLDDPKNRGEDGIPRVYSSYRTLVKTGRTSASDDNIQQIPREQWFRELFIPRPGFKLAAVDYSTIELCTLAVTCQQMFGYSKLGETIRRGIDPHEYTAALFRHISLDEFKDLKQTDPIRYRHDRQAAKALNFGTPGGLGAEKMVLYARANYGIDLTIEQAAVFRNMLKGEVYPEIGEYLKTDYVKNLSLTIGLTAERIESSLSIDGRGPDRWGGVCEKVARGWTEKVKEQDIDTAWGVMMDLIETTTGRTDEVRRCIEQRRPSMWLAAKLFSPPVCTLTGRIRGDVAFTESRNTRFQGLAADGAKIALWHALRDGIRVVAFVHDEIVAEIQDTSEAEKLSEIMKSAMSSVLDGFPVKTETQVGLCWRKP